MRPIVFRGGFLPPVYDQWVSRVDIRRRLIGWRVIAVHRWYRFDGIERGGEFRRVVGWRLTRRGARHLAVTFPARPDAFVVAG